MKNLSVFDLRHSKIRLLHNERTRWQVAKLEELCRSIAMTRGNVTPGVVELIGEYKKPGKNLVVRLNQEQTRKKPFQLIAGNRRFRATKLMGENFKCSVFYGLSDAERIEIQMIENSTKAQIKPSEMAMNLCELYKLAVAGYLGKRTYRQFSCLLKETDYDRLSKILTYANFARMMQINPKTFLNARLFDKTHDEIKRKVAEGSLRYYAAAQFGRMQAQDAQMRIYNRLKKSADRSGIRLSSNVIQTCVLGYIAAQQKTPLQLQAQESICQTEEINIRPLARTLAKLECLEVVDDELAGTMKKSLEEIVRSYLKDLCNLEKHYGTRLMKASDYYKKQKKPLLERLANGEFTIGRKPFATLDIGHAEYKEMPAKEIVPCRHQPRKTFEKLEEIAGTVKKYGILQAILVRPRNGKYELVAGERRYRAARMAGLRKIPVICCKMDDLAAHIIRREEDIFELVDARDRAETLYLLFKQLAKKKGYTEQEFASEYHHLKPVRERDVLDALHYSQLDRTTKGILTIGEKSYGHGVAIYPALPSERQHYALMAVLFDMPVQKVQNIIAQEQKQSRFNFPDFDYNQNRLQGLQRKVKDELVERLSLLENKKIKELDDKQLVTLYSIIESARRISLQQ